MSTNNFTAAILLCLFFISSFHHTLAQNEQLTKKQKKNQYENRFGQREDQVRTATQAVKFGEQVFKTVGRPHLSNIRYYTHDRLHSLLKEYDKHPETIELRIRIYHREQSERGFQYRRNKNIIELLRKKLNAVQGTSKQLHIIYRIIEAHSIAARHALRNKAWDKARSEYERIKKISSNFEEINQWDTADSMIQLINKRKSFEQETAKQVQQAMQNPEDQSANHKAGVRLAQLKRWSHALTFLQQAHGTKSSTPLLHMVQIAMTHHLQPNPTPNVLGKYLLQIDNIQSRLNDENLIRICLKIGFEIYSKIDNQRKDLTKTQNDQINSILQKWKKSIQEIGIDPMLSLSDEGPQNLFYPRDGLELYVPANGNKNDYSSRRRAASIRKGARVKLGAGILGALEFNGIDERWQNAIVFNNIDGSLYSKSFTVAFWFNRKKAVRTRASRVKVANVMFSLRAGNQDQVQIGSTQEFIQVYPSSRHRNPVMIKAGISSGSWYHLALTYDKKREWKAKLYLNGQLAKKWNVRGNSISAQKSHFVFGNTLQKPVPFNGLLDDLYFYRRSLTSQEVLELYNRPK